MTYILAPLAKTRCVTSTLCIGSRARNLWIREFAFLQDLHFGLGKGVPDSKISLMKKPQPFTKFLLLILLNKRTQILRNLIFHHIVELGTFISYFSKWIFLTAVNYILFNLQLMNYSFWIDYSSVTNFDSFLARWVIFSTQKLQVLYAFWKLQFLAKVTFRTEN